MTTNAPYRPLAMRGPNVRVQSRPDGSLRVESGYVYEDVERSIVHVLARQARAHPERVFLAQRAPDGAWRQATYADVHRRARAVAQALLSRALPEGRSVMILSGGSIEFAVVMLGAMMARVPVAPISVPFSLWSTDHGKLRHAFAVCRPAVIYTDDADRFARALQALDLTGVEVVTATGTPAVPRHSPLSAWLDTAPTPEVDDSIERIRHDTVAKWMFTSGSTARPRCVAQTQGMMCHQLASWAALEMPASDRPAPVILDWMPWSHVGGGNIGFNHNLLRGATVYLDEGRPMPGLFERTIANIKSVSPTEFSSVPVAFRMLVDALRTDEALCHAFFRRMETMAYGGAALPAPVAHELQTLAVRTVGHRIPFTTIYGATETQCITQVHWTTDETGLVGLPLPGVQLKLVPTDDRYALRVRGPTVTPGHDLEPTGRQGFDEEGFYELGDAVRFLDPARPEAGLVFAGRLAEDFKLNTGTSVAASALRQQVLSTAAPLLSDCVVCGLGEEAVGVLAWLNPSAITALLGPAPDDVPPHARQDVLARLREAFEGHNRAFPGSSQAIRRLLLVAEPPSFDTHELTDKGSINQRVVRENRAELVRELFAPGPGPRVLVLD
ncbi:AMP-binding protein [Myxococcus sp. AM010]|uniref:AMP-binding protein n=1 Tax=Myxococcus sp. AM010 TaxID=2745138 RepID=UPI001595E8EF|nr:AMP-binding protein [Myxococcus sp. AM010]NVJ18969.1 AMP-binding protein [Myxococcus sp. AM010]